MFYSSHNKCDTKYGVENVYADKEEVWQCSLHLFALMLRYSCIILQGVFSTEPAAL